MNYSTMMFLSLLSILVLFIIFWSSVVNMSEFIFLRSKSSTFECGFEVKDQSRQPFSLRFFLIIMVFLVFDMELCLLLKIPFLKTIKFFSSRYMMFLMVTMLMLGIIEEWRRGLLMWK